MAVSELPGNPNAVWTVRRHIEGRKSSCVERTGKEHGSFPVEAPGHSWSAHNSLWGSVVS